MTFSENLLLILTCIIIITIINYMTIIRDRDGGEAGRAAAPPPQNNIRLANADQ